MTLRGALRIILLLLGPATALPAQSPADRQMLAAFEDSLLRATSSAVVKRYSPTGRSRTDASPLRDLMRRARLAMMQKNNGDLERALRGLLLEASKHPDWPWPSLVLARTYEAMHHGRLLAGGWSGEIEGESHARAAWRQIATVMSIDPDFDRGRQYYLDKMMALGDRMLRPEEQAPLRSEVARNHPDPRALIVWARVTRARGMADSALALLERARALGGDPSVLGLERARTMRMTGDTLGARVAYWEGLHPLSSDGRALYRYDLEWIIGSDSLRSFDRLMDEEVSGWLKRFWAERDASAVLRPGERLQEHLARWGTAVTSYRVSSPWRRTEMRRVESAWDGRGPCMANDEASSERLLEPQPSLPGDLRDTERLFDQRGIVYLRHGAPLRDLPAPPGTEKTEERQRAARSWLYWFDGGYRLLTFRGSDALGQQAPTTLSRDETLGIPDTPPDPRGDRASGAADVPAKCRSTVPVPLPRRVEALPSVLESDTDLPPLRDAWQGLFWSYALGPDSAGSGRALITFAIPGDKLKVDFDGARPVWPVQMRVVAWESRTGRRVELDTLHRYTTPPSMGTRGFLTGWLELPLEPGDWQIAVLASQASDSAGMFGLQRHIVIPRLQGLTLSDPLRGIDGAHLWPGRDGRGFPLNTLATWTPDTPLNLYFEIYGLVAGQSYRTTYQVREAGPLGAKVVDFGFNDVATGPTTVVRQVVGVEHLPPGVYTLILGVSTGKSTVERRMTFDVLDR